MSDNRSATPASVSSASGNQALAVADIQLKLLSTLSTYNKKNNAVLQYSFAIKSTKLTLEVDIVPGVENRHTAGGRGSRRRRKKRKEMQQLHYKQRKEEQPPDDDFSVVIEHTDEALPVQSMATVLARSYDARWPQFQPKIHGHVLRELHQPRSHNIPAEWARSQTDVTEAPDEQHSRQTISFQHPGTKIGKMANTGKEQQ